MRPSLLHPLARAPSRAAAPGAPATARGATASRHERMRVDRHRDPAVQRVRDAGGPIDRASYSCAVRLPVQRERLDQRELPALRRRAGLVIEQGPAGAGPCPLASLILRGPA